jgi:hypothetical protein
LSLLYVPATDAHVTIRIGDVVMLPGYAPYPRYGRVAKIEDGQHLRVTDVQCGDPRCAAEHRHSDQVWPIEATCATRAYQARAAWEEGRKSSPNAVS